MAGGKGNYLSNKFLNQIFNGASAPAPGTLYVALYTATPSASGGGTEVSGGSYARVAVTANTTNFPTSSAEQIQNGTTIDFGTASADWGTIVAGAVWDASSGGNLLYWGPLATSRTVVNGDSFKFNTNGATFTEA